MSTWDGMAGIIEWDSTEEQTVGGLTSDEQEVIRHLVLAWNGYNELPPIRTDNQDHDQQFRNAIHSAQQVLGQRVLHREHPELWT